jgi:hypothetical protein
MITTGSQLELDFRPTGRGGRRKGAGRKASADRKGFVEHVARPPHDDEKPVHVTVRAVGHFTVQGNHLHMIVEANEGLSLSRGMQRLLSRLAMTINAIARRRGKVWRDRYHRRDLCSPRQFRNALVYVLFNRRKHAPTDRDAELWAGCIDPCSSAAWFTGWVANSGPPQSSIARAGPSVIAEPKSWLARGGWERRGRIRLDERVPAAA